MTEVTLKTLRNGPDEELTFILMSRDTSEDPEEPEVPICQEFSQENCEKCPQEQSSSPLDHGQGSGDHPQSSAIKRGDIHQKISELDEFLKEVIQNSEDSTEVAVTEGAPEDHELDGDPEDNLGHLSGVVVTEVTTSEESLDSIHFRNRGTSTSAFKIFEVLSSRSDMGALTTNKVWILSAGEAAILPIKSKYYSRGPQRHFVVIGINLETEVVEDPLNKVLTRIFQKIAKSGRFGMRKTPPSISYHFWPTPVSNQGHELVKKGKVTRRRSIVDDGGVSRRAGDERNFLIFYASALIILCTCAFVNELFLS